MKITEKAYLNAGNLPKSAMNTRSEMDSTTSATFRNTPILRGLKKKKKSRYLCRDLVIIYEFEAQSRRLPGELNIGPKC